MPSKRLPARRGADYLPEMAKIARAGGNTFEGRASTARILDSATANGRENNGAFMRKADRSRIKATVRQIRKDASVRGNDYQYGTKEQVQAQHSARYRNIRRSFGLSAG